MPSDFVDAFVQAAVKWAAAPTSDPDVADAVALGWRIGEAFTWAATRQSPPIADLSITDDADRWTVLVGQIEAARGRLAKNGASNAGASAAAKAPAPAASLDPDKPPPATTDEDVKALYRDMLRTLWIADTSRGRGLDLGHELQQLCASPDEQIATAFQKRGPVITSLLLALASKLPPNAAHSVKNSFSLWEDQLNEPAAAETAVARPSAGALSEHLVRQGAIWRTILTGECAATHVLRLSDYVGTAEEVVDRLQEMAVTALRSSLIPWLGAAALLAVIGIVVLVAFNGSASGVAAGLTSLLSALGLTWKGIGTFIGKAAAKGEQALWDAQVDWTIAYRCTVDLKPDPRQRTSNRETRMQTHVERWRAWQTNWPSLRGEPDSER